MKLEDIRWALGRIKWRTFLISFGVIFVAVIVSVLLSGGSFAAYKDMYKPPLAPPGWVFPIVWTILYSFMAASAYLVYISCAPDKMEALKLYLAQLVVNVLWPVIFFRMEAYLLGFAWILLLWYLVLEMTKKFLKINKLAGKLMVVYLVWLTFAAYLNLAILINQLVN